ncbi:MAG: hypothetical protein JSW60_07510 [Thermoplasmatales archaeon]|nr:MAG: hypothetical protein JSW60_07510 [Thermoplasmatales archaeon]
MKINSNIIKKHFIGKAKNVRILKGDLSLFGKILETDGDCVVFQTKTQISIIPIRDIDEILLINGGGR